MFKPESILNRFADFFKKNPDSNLGKIITIFSEQLQQIDETSTRIKEWRSIDNAQGSGLDLIGGTVNQERGTATDEVYRLLLKSKIARSLSDGGINTIIRVLSIALDAHPSEIQIKEKWHDIDPESAAISLIQIPIGRLNEIGIAPDQFARIVQKTVSAGIKVDVIELAGTFTFGPIPIEKSAKAGFADIDGTTGGTLGTAYVPESGQDLPI